MHNTSFDFQGATAYLDWDYVFPELFCTSMHTNCRNYNLVTFYVNWDFVIPTWNFELSVLVTDWLNKHVLSYDIIIITCITALVRERACLRTLHLSSTCIWQHSRHYCTVKDCFTTISITTVTLRFAAVAVT